MRTPALATASVRPSTPADGRRLRLAEGGAGSELQRHDELLALLVHDFKAPLAALLATTHALALSATLQEVDRMLLEEIETSARSLDRLVLDLLDLHRSQTTRLQPVLERVDLAEIAQNAIESVGIYARHAGKKVEIIAPDRVQVRADRDLLRRTHENLLDNACRYARRRIALEIRPTATGASIEVRDDGVGIPAGQEEAIFDKYVRIDAVGRRGRGLGLTFCRMAVEAIRAFPNEPEGAAFRVELVG